MRCAALIRKPTSHCRLQLASHMVELPSCKDDANSAVRHPEGTRAREEYLVTTVLDGNKGLARIEQDLHMAGSKIPEGTAYAQECTCTLS